MSVWVEQGVGSGHCDFSRQGHWRTWGILERAGLMRFFGFIAKLLKIGKNTSLFGPFCRNIRYSQTRCLVVRGGPRSASSLPAMLADIRMNKGNHSQSIRSGKFAGAQVLDNSSKAPFSPQNKP